MNVRVVNEERKKKRTERERSKNRSDERRKEKGSDSGGKSARQTVSVNAVAYFTPFVQCEKKKSGEVVKKSERSQGRGGETDTHPSVVDRKIQQLTDQ